MEELAYAAQSFGYEGSVPFHGWGMDELRGELAEGRSVVVSLGVDPSLSLRTGGDHEPGHMVTVTGVSADGERVYYNDPTLGKQVVSRAEFERMWGSQGNSGVAVRREVPAGEGEAGAAPWVALAAGLMAAVSGAGLGGLREGVGGALMGSSGASGKKKRSKSYNDDGGTMSLKKAHKRARRKRKARRKKRRKRKKRKNRAKRRGRRGRGGVKVDAKEVGTDRSGDGPEPQVTPSPSPTPSDERVPSESEILLVNGGWPTESNMRGTPEPEWQMDNMMPSTGVDFPPAIRAPHPPGHEPEEVQVDLPDMEGSWISKGIKLAKGIGKVVRSRSLHFNSLESGQVGVVVDDAIEVGEKVAYREGYGFRGTRYLPSTIAQISGRKLIGDVFSKASILTAAGASLLANGFDYSIGENRDKGIASQELVVSTAVDTAASLAVGAASAALVAGAVALIGVTTPFTVPIAAAAVVTIALSVYLGSKLDESGFVDGVKAEANISVDHLQEDIDAVMEVPIPDHGIGVMGRPFGIVGDDKALTDQ